MGTILNVNVPDVPYGELQGFEVTRLGTRHGAEPTIRQLDPRGHPVYWVGPAGRCSGCRSRNGFRRYFARTSFHYAHPH